MNNDRINFYGTTRRTESSARLNQEQILSQGSVSDAIRKLYQSLEDKNKYDVEQSYSYQHNQAVAAFLFDQIKERYDTKYSDRDNAVHQYYESRKRVRNDSVPARREAKLRNQRRSKKVLRQKALFERRSKVVNGEKENRFWKEINFHYMTEEDSNDDGLFVTHKFEWRSNKLNSLIDHLDRKIQQTDSRFQRKERIPGEVSSTPPPANVPVWALSKNYRKSAPPTSTSSEVLPETPESLNSSCDSSHHGSLQGQQVTPHRSMLRTLMSSSSSPHGFSGSVVQVQPVTPQRPTYRTSVPSILSTSRSYEQDMISPRANAASSTATNTQVSADVLADMISSEQDVDSDSDF